MVMNFSTLTLLLPAAGDRNRGCHLPPGPVAWSPGAVTQTGPGLHMPHGLLFSLLQGKERKKKIWIGLNSCPANASVSPPHPRPHPAINTGLALCCNYSFKHKFTTHCLEKSRLNYKELMKTSFRLRHINSNSSKYNFYSYKYSL